MLGLASALVLLAGCVDPANLKGYQCDSAGANCVPPQSGGGGASGGGTGGGEGGGSGGGGAGGGGATGGGGGVGCGATSCTGCCDGTTCVPGTALTQCGMSGNACVDCGSGQRCMGGACEALVSNGGACSSGEQCSSTFCATGVCCGSACSGSCETCAAMGSEGRCTPLAESAVVAACGDYACDGVSGSCPTACTSSRLCAAGRFCSSAGTCIPLKANGDACQSSVECTSTFCADGVCCSGACTGSCDACDLSGQGGNCLPAPVNSPGSPACPSTAVCNGTLPDCPILCSGGCPTDTWCSGTYCAAKKSAGATCGAPGECLSNFCADGVCCDTACAGACDACSVTAGASTNGSCTLVGSSRICRTPANACDVEERCSGSAAACPSNGFADAGTGCGQTSYGTWSACTAGSTCGTSGTQTRTRTDRTCNTAGACGPAASPETQACTRTTDGTSCGTPTTGAWTACSYADSCVTTGSRTRSRTDAVCSGGTCGMVMTTETDTAGCTRTTNGTSCGSSSFGAWGSCGFSGTCAETGSRTRTRTDQVCGGGTCGSMTATETDTAGCTRSTTGQSCGATSTGAWGSCAYAMGCSTSGSRTRTVDSYSCGSGACNTSSNTETDTAGCARSTTGQSCGTTAVGAWGACSYADGCSSTGSRTRSVTTYTCDALSSCGASTVTETDTAGCARSTSGQSCGTTAVGAWSACGYADGCSNGGTRSRSITTYTCQSDTCQAAPTTENDTAGCARSQDGLNCGAAVYGDWSGCSYADLCVNSGTRSRAVTTYTCGSNTCNAGSGTEYDSTACARSTEGATCAAPVCGSCTCRGDCIKFRDCTYYTCTTGVCTGVFEYEAQACGSCSGPCY